jgi:integrase
VSHWRRRFADDGLEGLQDKSYELFGLHKACAIMGFMPCSDISREAYFTKGGRILNARLSDRSVAEIIKTHAARVGLDPAQFSGHSLRSGFLTSAAARGASIFKLADQSRHKSMDVLRSYVRDAEVFRNHAGDGLL